MVEGVMNLPAWESPRWAGVGLVLVAGFVLLWRLDRWATRRRQRIERERREEMLARRAAGRARGEVMARTSEHRAVRIPGPGPSAVPLLEADRAQLLAMVRGLQERLRAAEAELAIRPDPDPILSALSVRPLSLSQLAATVGAPYLDVERDCRRLIHITEQVEKIRPGGRGDWKYQLRGTRSARPGTVPARGEAG